MHQREILLTPHLVGVIYLEAKLSIISQPGFVYYFHQEREGLPCASEGRLQTRKKCNLGHC